MNKKDERRLNAEIERCGTCSKHSIGFPLRTMICSILRFSYNTREENVYWVSTVSQSNSCLLILTRSCEWIDKFGGFSVSVKTFRKAQDITPETEKLNDKSKGYS